MPLGDIGRDLSGYPFLLILGQDDNERQRCMIAILCLTSVGSDLAWCAFKD